MTTQSPDRVKLSDVWMVSHFNRAIVLLLILALVLDYDDEEDERSQGKGKTGHSTFSAKVNVPFDSRLIGRGPLC